ncbi:MAG TPA: EscU/YscU/HrcU family type III secretion system export apparatus switch protein [Polyangiaceae bacterium]|nr:EscU/YscU/HrcU family type III secretion system export apparatus switch protein [Polyangiaceae bacterium]
MASDTSDKTEQPTPRRLRKAREEGDSAVSVELGRSIGLLVVLAVLPGLLAAIAAGAGAALRAAINGGGRADPSGAAWLLVSLATPLLAAAAAVSAALGLIQSGAAFSAARFRPDFSRVDPFQGIRHLITLERLFALGRALFAALLIGFLAWSVLRDHALDLASLAGRGESVATASWRLGRRLLWSAALVGILLGAIDYFFVRRAWLLRHRMTKDEVKREHREAEGDPEVRAARRRAHQEALAGSMIAAVKDATVLIVNPTHLATALRYDEDQDEAPVVVAHGEGELARLLVEAAHAYGVPVVRDVPVAHALRELGLGDEIPEALYEAVAEVLRELLGPPTDAEEPGAQPQFDKL